MSTWGAWLQILAWVAAVWAGWRLLEWAAGPQDADDAEQESWQAFQERMRRERRR